MVSRKKDFIPRLTEVIANGFEASEPALKKTEKQKAVVVADVYGVVSKEWSLEACCNVLVRRLKKGTMRRVNSFAAMATPGGGWARTASNNNMLSWGYPPDTIKEPGPPGGPSTPATGKTLPPPGKGDGPPSGWKGGPIGSNSGKEEKVRMGVESRRISLTTHVNLPAVADEECLYSIYIENPAPTLAPGRSHRSVGSHHLCISSPKLNKESFKAILMLFILTLPRAPPHTSSSLFLNTKEKPASYEHDVITLTTTDPSPL